MIATITPEQWFYYVFGTVFAIGAAIFLLFFLAAMFGFDFWDKD